MTLKSISLKLKQLLSKYLYNAKWTCNACGREIFSGEYFCEKCLNKLPLNDKAICDHCGRQVQVDEKYCTTCKNNLVSMDKARSCFVYERPISSLIKQFKYKNKRYLLEVFCHYLAKTYRDNRFDADVIVYVPMTEKSITARGYNQSQLLAEGLAEEIKVPVVHTLKKTRETLRQATINRKDRMGNLVGAFAVSARKDIKDKKVLIVDDVSTTGTTGEILARKLKKAGAKTVYLLTVASVPPKDKY